MKYLLYALVLMTVCFACSDTAQDSKANGSDSSVLQQTDQAASDSAARAAADITVSNPTLTATATLVRDRLASLYRNDLDKGLVDTFSRHFIYAEADLNGDGTKEILVGTRGPFFCGSGGCTILLLDASGKTINKFSVSHYPVTIDDQKSNGWNNLLIPSGGKLRVLRFNGQHYPTNPSVATQYQGAQADNLPKVLEPASSQWIVF